MGVESQICSPLHEQGIGTESSNQGAMHIFIYVYVVHLTMPKVGQYLKGYWLTEFPEQCVMTTWPDFLICAWVLNIYHSIFVMLYVSGSSAH